MLIRVVSIGLVGLGLSVSVAGGESLSDRLQAGRMTVLEVNAKTGQFRCLEHKRWTSVPNGELSVLGAGDIVKVETGNGGVHRVIKLRGASDDLASPEL
jgi:hypothetical protein